MPQIGFENAIAINRTVRSAKESDRHAVISTLAQAFWDDPFLLHFYPHEAARARRIHLFFDLLWRANAPLGHIDICGDGTTAALWRPPGRWQIPTRTIVANWPAMLRAYGPAMGKVLKTMRVMAQHHPRSLHWYLMTVGTDPAHQGLGVAGSVIRSRLALCDVSGTPAYLEAATERHIPFYSSFGFRLTGEVKVAGVPTFFPMWRDPER